MNTCDKTVCANSQSLHHRWGQGCSSLRTWRWRSRRWATPWRGTPGSHPSCRCSPWGTGPKPRDDKQCVINGKHVWLLKTCVTVDKQCVIEDNVWLRTMCDYKQCVTEDNVWLRANSVCLRTLYEWGQPYVTEDNVWLRGISCNWGQTCVTEDNVWLQTMCDWGQCLTEGNQV